MPKPKKPKKIANEDVLDEKEIDGVDGDEEEGVSA